MCVLGMNIKGRKEVEINTDTKEKKRAHKK
jgi:hypothetical protein